MSNSTPDPHLVRLIELFNLEYANLPIRDADEITHDVMESLTGTKNLLGYHTEYLTDYHLGLIREEINSELSKVPRLQGFMSRYESLSAKEFVEEYQEVRWDMHGADMLLNMVFLWKETGSFRHHEVYPGTLFRINMRFSIEDGIARLIVEDRVFNSFNDLDTDRIRMCRNCDNAIYVGNKKKLDCSDKCRTEYNNRRRAGDPELHLIDLENKRGSYQYRARIKRKREREIRAFGGKEQNETLARLNSHS